MMEGRHSIKTCPTGFNWMAAATWVLNSVLLQWQLLFSSVYKKREGFLSGQEHHLPMCSPTFFVRPATQKKTFFTNQPLHPFTKWMNDHLRVGCYHTVAILSPADPKTLLLLHLNSFRYMSTRESGYEICVLWPTWPPRDKGQLPVVASNTNTTPPGSGFLWILQIRPPSSSTMDFSKGCYVKAILPFGKVCTWS